MRKKKNVVLVVGAKRSYGEWFVRFCKEKLKNKVIATDVEDDANLEAIARNSNAVAAIMCVPISAAPDVARRLAISLPNSVIVDFTGVKLQVFCALNGRDVAFSLLHPMCAPPKERTLGDQPLIVAYEDIPMDGEIAEWYREFRKALGGRIVRSSVAEHDQLAEILQEVPQALIVAYAEAIVRSEIPIKRLLETASPVSRLLIEAVQRHFMRGSPRLFAEIQHAFLKDPHNRGLSQAREILSGVTAEAPVNITVLEAMWRRVRAELNLDK